MYPGASFQASLAFSVSEQTKGNQWRSSAGEAQRHNSITEILFLWCGFS